MCELAIASVPIQKWEQPNTPQEALNMGSIFNALHKPFFIEEEMKPREVMPESECESLLKKIQQITFCLIDLTLFLDNHPQEQEACDWKAQLQQERKELLAQFALKFYPLTMDCEGCPTDAPAPWEGVC